jgi:hypothetical protein
MAAYFLNGMAQAAREELRPYAANEKSDPNSRQGQTVR